MGDAWRGGRFLWRTSRQSGVATNAACKGRLHRLVDGHDESGSAFLLISVQIRGRSRRGRGGRVWRGRRRCGIRNALRRGLGRCLLAVAVAITISVPIPIPISLPLTIAVIAGCRKRALLPKDATNEIANVVEKVRIGLRLGVRRRRRSAPM